MESNTEKADLHVAVVDRPESGWLSGVVDGNNGNALPVPQQEGERCDEEEVPWGRVRTTRGERGLWGAHPMLEPRSLPLSLAPTAKFTIQATMLKSNVAPRTSHN